MSSADVIDALFDRTVDIVQSLPKSGPIQTSYEEKLALYSLYKQATDGDVASKRPGMLDMLGRAKWDAWSQRQGMDPLTAKQLYVESMMRTLRKFADRPQARHLIEELEAFSGDVAERVMRGALETDDTDSEASSAPAPLRHRPQRAPSDEEGDDRLSSLRPTGHQQQQHLASAAASGSRRPIAPQHRYSQGSSVEGASILAAHGGRSRASIGSSTPQRRASDAGDLSDGDDTEEEHGYPGPLPSSASLRGPSGIRPLGPGSGRPTTGPPPAPSSLTGGSRGGHPLPHSYSQRGISGTPTGHAAGSRFGPGQMAPPPPPPPRSESNAGGFLSGPATGGAGGSLYSAVGPSSRPVEHHYYHGAPASAAGGTRAPSSIGGRSNPGTRTGPTGPHNREIDQALQSIQASLAGLHERLNRVENTSAGQGVAGAGAAGAGGGRRPSRSGSSALAGAYDAVVNAVHDIAVLLGVAQPSAGGGTVAAPSFGAPRTNGRPSILRAPLTLVLAMVNLALRLALDLTSLGILLTVLLFLVKRITGRGDPLVLLRLARRLLGRRAGAAERAAVVGASAAAAAVAGAAGAIGGSAGVGSGDGTTSGGPGTSLRR
ncbi:unnamed protein product [Parajaminaea phylloscopi]